MPKKVLALVIVAVAAIAGLALYYFVLREKGIVEKIKEKGYIVVGTSADFPPFEMVNEKGEIVGLDIDIAKKIAEKLGVKLVIKDMAFEGLIPALLSGDVDMVIAGMTITEERAKVVDFSIPYFEADQAVLVLKSREDIKSVDDLAGKKIGVQEGTTGDFWVTDNLAKKGKVKEEDVKRYPKLTVALLELKSGGIDAVVIDKPAAEMYAKLDESLKVAFVIKTGEKYGIAVKKGNKDLLQVINQVIKELIESGELEKLIKKWFG